MSCYFEANTSGGVVLSGIPTETGLYELALSAAVSLILKVWELIRCRLFQYSLRSR